MTNFFKIGSTSNNQLDINDNYAGLRRNNLQNPNIEKLDNSDNKNKKQKNTENYHELQEEV